MGYDGAPTTGTYAVDTTNDRIGEVRRWLEGAVHLIPPGGGHEWAVHPDQLRKPTGEERARALVPRAAGLPVNAPAVHP